MARPKTRTLRQYVDAQPRTKRLAVIAAELGIQPPDLTQALRYGLISRPKAAKLKALGIVVTKPVEAAQ